MKITRENYESYFIDYLDGNLDARMVDEFIAFIQENPDLKEELSLFEPVKLPAGEINLEIKEKLYRERLDSDKEFETAAIARLEGDLSTYEMVEFEDYLARNPGKRKEVLLFEKTRLTAENLAFPGKLRLYKKPLSRTLFIWTSRVAAILILIWVASVTLFKPFNPKDTEFQKAAISDKNQVSENNFGTIPDKTASPVLSVQKPVEIKKLASLKEVSNPVKVKDANLMETESGKREVVISPSYLTPLSAGIQMKIPDLSLAKLEKTEPLNLPRPDEEERLRADVIKEKLNLENFTFRKIARTGLSLAIKLTGEKFTYSTNSENQVTAYAFDSRLVGFSIPDRKSVV